MAPDDPDPYEDEDDEDVSSDDEDEEGPEVAVTVEILGLSLYTHHGVTAAEREIGQRLVLDVRFDVGEPDALITDRLASQFGAQSVTVKAAKPEPPIPLPVEEVSVEIWRDEHT